MIRYSAGTDFYRTDVLVDQPPIDIIVRFFCFAKSLIFSIPPLSPFLPKIFVSMSGAIFSPLLKADSKSVSPVENRQFFILPSAVKRIRLQEPQNGLVTELMIANVPWWPDTL